MWLLNMAGDIDQPVFPFRHRPPVFYDIVTVTKKDVRVGAIACYAGSLCSTCSVLYLFSIFNHQVNKLEPKQSLLGFSGAHQVANFSTTAACAQMRLLILRGHSWLPFYVIR